MRTDFWKGRRVVITGSSGFLAGWLAELLLNAGARVWGFDVVEGTSLRVRGLADRVSQLRGSILDLAETERAIRDHGIEVCFHLAAQSTMSIIARDVFAAYEVNVRGSYVVLEACRRAETIRAVVSASSNHAYGPQKNELFTEDQPLNQLDVYGATKACTDILTRSFAYNFDLPAAVVRNVNTFGGGDPHVTHLVPSTVLALLRGERPVIQSDGTPLKAYLYARDTMDAYMAVAEHAGEPGVKGEAFNVTPHQPTRVIDLVRLIVKASGQTGLEPVVAASDLSQKDFYEHLSGDKIKRAIGWEPKVPLEDGLRETYEWYAKHGIDWAHGGPQG